MAGSEIEDRRPADALIERVKARFRHPHWERLELLSPAQVRQLQEDSGFPTDTVPLWEVHVMRSAQDSRSDSDEDTVLRPALAFESLAHLLTHDERSLTYHICMAIAAQEAHEALEWLWFDQDLVVDPHVTGDAFDQAVVDLEFYFRAAAG